MVTASTLGATYARMKSRGIVTQLAVELAEVVPPPGLQYPLCAWCAGPATFAVVLELVPAVDDDDQAAGEPFGGAEVERQLCQRCLERIVPDAAAGIARLAGHELTPGLQEALRDGFGPLLRKLGASAELAAAARFVVLAPNTPVPLSTPST